MKRLIVILTLCIIVSLPLQFGNVAVVKAELEDDLISILEQELSLINKEVSDIKKEVLEIKKILKAILERKKSKIVEVNVDDDPFLGTPTAPVTLVEFSDYQCQYCSSFVKSVLPVLKKEYINTGKLKYVFRDLPLDMHKEAQKAAEAGQCAHEQGKYWEMHDTMFANQQKLDVESLRGYAAKIGLDMNTFNLCLDNGKYATEINKDTKDAGQIGVNGTPTFIIGKTNPNGIIRGQVVMGAIPYAVFKSLIESALQNKKQQNK